MKIKNNNQIKLIPRKQIGGLVPKYQNSGFLSRVWNNAKERTKNDILGRYGKVGRILAMPGELVRGWFTEPPANVSLKTTNAADVSKKVDNSKKSEVKRGFSTDKYDNTSAPKGVISTQKPSDSKSTDTQGNGTRGGTRNGTRGRKGNARTTAKPAARTTTTTPAVKSTINVPNGMEYASDYLNASTPDSISSTYNTLAQNVLSDVDKRIAEIRPTISSRSTYADMEDAMAGWDLKRKQKMMDASVGTAWDWNTEEGRKNFVGMANLMKNGKGNYNKIYDQWIASQPKTTESQNETYAQRFPLAYQSGLLTTPITDNLSLTTQQPTSTNQPSVGWVNTQAIQDAVNRVMPQLSVGNTNNNNFTTLELPQNFSGFATDLFKRKRTGNWTFAKQGTKLIRRK